MAKRACWREIPTELSLERFKEFILPHLTVGSRGPAPKLSLHALFNYVLKLLYLGCQWKELPIEKDATGRREIHHIRIWRTFRRWVADGCFNAIFEETVLTLHQTTAAKKGGDNIGFNGHKKIKGDKVVALCDRNCNVIAPVHFSAWQSRMNRRFSPGGITPGDANRGFHRHRSSRLYRS